MIGKTGKHSSISRSAAIALALSMAVVCMAAPVFAADTTGYVTAAATRDAGPAPPFRFQLGRQRMPTRNISHNIHYMEYNVNSVFKGSEFSMQTKKSLATKKIMPQNHLGKEAIHGQFR
jgi:hypothetical protein